jgi:hypothetical protein
VRRVPASRLVASLAGLAVRTTRALREACRPSGIAGGFIADLTRSRAELPAENAFLRQQLIVASRSVKRPGLRRHERGLLVLLARLVPRWRHALLLVKPGTVLRCGIPPVLASSMPLGRTKRAAGRSGCHRPHPAYGGREPPLGGRAHSRRTLEARHPRREAIQRYMRGARPAAPAVDSAGGHSSETTRCGLAISCRPTTSGSVPSSRSSSST